MEGTFGCVFMNGAEENEDVRIAPFQLTTEAAGRLDAGT